MVEFEGQRISNVPSEVEWWRFGDHRHSLDLVCEKEAEQVAILWETRQNQIHFCVQYREWKSCKLMSPEGYVELSPQEVMELVQSEINFLRLMYEN